MKAMILAAGEGVRLRPLTLDTPKVLLAVKGTPIIEHTILWLKYHGISEIAINVCHLSSQIIDYLGDGEHLGVNIKYSVEENLLGTAGGVKKMTSYLGKNFLVIYGDIFTDINLSKMISLHYQKRAVATLALFKSEKPWEVGIVTMNGDGLITDFVEKPPKGSERSNLASGGIYVLNKQVLSYIPNDISCDFGRKILPNLVKRKLPVYGYLLSGDDYLIDIGTKENYLRANNEVINTSK
jgi:NDP-sugar pyrophosphorylase family protein